MPTLTNNLHAAHADFITQARSLALSTGKPVDIATFAPVIPLNNPVAVKVSGAGRKVVVEASTGEQTSTRSGKDALHALTDIGVGTDTRYTLVVADAHSLAALVRLALQDPTCPASAVVAWWDQRADFPGTSAVMLAVRAASLRWTLGLSPNQESNLDIWLSCLNVKSPGVDGLLEFARLIASGPVLPGLLDLAESDQYSWHKFLKRIQQGWDWRSPDTKVDAALGLLGRCDAAEHFASLRLNDPLVAMSETSSGTVVPGTVIALHGKTALVRADVALSRLRVGSQVEAWQGGPENAALTSFDSNHPKLRSARVARTYLDHSGNLHLALDEASPTSAFYVGDTITLRPLRTDRFQQQRGRSRRAVRLLTDGNWLAGRGRPLTRRRDVPLDVMLAAADD